MFGIGLPELILIMGVALIVVGPEKLPEMAKSIAKGVLELKKTAASLKDSLSEEMDELKDEDPWQQHLGDKYPNLPSTSVNEGPEIDVTPPDAVAAPEPVADSAEEGDKAGEKETPAG